MPSRRAKELWNSGIPLSGAWLEFAPPELRAEYENLPEFLEGWSTTSDTDLRNGFISAFAETAKNSDRKRRLEIDLKEHLLTELFNAQMVATGYRISPSRSQAPVLIDPEKFDLNDPDWFRDAFEFEGIRYSRIKITDPARLEAVNRRAKGSLDAIDAAIDHLKNHNPGFCDLKRKTACDQIRKLLGEQEITRNGLSDNNLGKAIVRKCGKKRISRN